MSSINNVMLFDWWIPDPDNNNKSLEIEEVRAWWFIVVPPMQVYNKSIDDNDSIMNWANTRFIRWVPNKITNDKDIGLKYKIQDAKVELEKFKKEKEQMQRDIGEMKNFMLKTKEKEEAMMQNNKALENENEELRKEKAAIELEKEKLQRENEEKQAALVKNAIWKKK